MPLKPLFLTCLSRAVQSIACHIVSRLYRLVRSGEGAETVLLHDLSGRRRVCSGHDAVIYRLFPVLRDGLFHLHKGVRQFYLRQECRNNSDEIIDFLMKVSAMVEIDPAIREIDINPLMLYGDGRPATAVDAVVIREVEN